MSLKQLNQKGFAAVEALLIVIILAILGGTGYYVYHANSKATDAQNTAQTDANSAVQHKKKTATKSAKAANSSTSVFKISELGIEITVPNSIKDIVYKYDGSSTLSTGQKTQSVTLSTQTLSDMDKDCSVTGGAPPLGAISKTTGQYPKNGNIENTSGALIKQFPDYYIAWSNPQAGCGSGSTTTTAAKDTVTFTKALRTIQPIQ